MVTMLWDQKDGLLVDFMEPGKAIRLQVYCETLSKLRCVIQNWRLECRGQ